LAVAFHHRPAEAIETAFSALTAVHCADALAYVGKDGDEKPATDGAYLDRLGLAAKIGEWRKFLED
jgi:hypothetical protein